MTGALTLNADPTADLQAATKKYVDGLTRLSYVSKIINPPVTSYSITGLTTGYDVIKLQVLIENAAGSVTLWVNMPVPVRGKGLVASAVGGMPAYAISSKTNSIDIVLYSGYRISYYELVLLG